MFKGLSLNTKMIIPSVILSIALGALGWVGFTALAHVAISFEKITDVTVPKLTRADLMFLTFRTIRINVRALGIHGITEKQGEIAIQSMLAAIEEYTKIETEYEGLEFIPGEKERYEKVSHAWEKFKVLGAQIIALYRTGDPTDRAKMNQIFFGECLDLANEYKAAMMDLTNFHGNNAIQWNKEADIEKENALRTILYTVSFSIILGIILTVFSIRSVTTLIRSITDVSEKLAEGASKVADIAGQVSLASDSLSSSATEQAAALQETTSAVEETNAMVTKNAENAGRSSEISTQSQTSATRGQSIVTEMIGAIDEISRSNNEIMQQMEASNREIAEIVTVIGDIGNKTKVINDIVFQTKLLSFNASVEAARAGEQGKGFAVVAEEVGNLAQMSGNSAKEISDMLDASIKRVEAIVENTKTKVDRLIQEGTEKIKNGTDSAQRCGEVLEEIVGNVSNVGGMVAEIAVASKEQSQGINEITKAITELDSAAQQNTAAAEQTSVSAEELKVQVNSLRSVIGDLRRLVNKTDDVSTSNIEATRPTGKVLPMKHRSAKPPMQAQTQYKKAAGDSHKTPSSVDPRFEEI